jgi:putative oxidoreductase
MDSIDIGLLALRVVAGTLVLGHGLGNLFGWLGGFGLAGTGEIFERLGFRPGRFYAGVAGLTEVGAGALLVAGLATPLAAAGLVGVMVNTVFTAHRGKGPWYFNGGWEYNLTLAAVAAALGFAGPGAASLDHAIGFEPGTVRWGVATLAAGLAAGAAVLTLARRAPEGA